MREGSHRHERAGARIIPMARASSFVDKASIVDKALSRQVDHRGSCSLYALQGEILVRGVRGIW